MKFKAKSILPAFLSVLLVVTQSGCTYALWSDQDYQAYHQPAKNSDLHLFESKKHNDILVVYKEQSEKTEHIKTRAYWLDQNQIRVTREAPPIFISEKAARNLPAVPVFNSMPTNKSAMLSLYAVCGTNQSFKVYSEKHEAELYHLPAYEAKRPVGEKVALTPVTIAGDAAIAAAVAGLIVLVAWAAIQE